MSKTIINKNKFDSKKEPLFFGEKLNLQRYDNPKYPAIAKFFDNHMEQFWKPEEVDLGKDISDFNTLQEHEKFIFTKNLSYQILLDSIQSRGISNLLENCSNNELEAFAKIWEFFETVHSKSYTHIIRRIYPNPEVILDNIMDDEEILKRTSSVTKYYDDLINNIGNETLYELKKKLYLTICSINILEGIRFYVSFACSFAFAQNKKMEGNAKIISLIARDENLHLGFTQYLLNILRNNESEGFVEVAKDCEETVRQMFKDAAEEEMVWAEYLFKDGKSMLGLNKEVLIQYMKYLTYTRMKSIRMEPVYPATKNNLNFIDAFINSSSVQVAPQETEIENYLIGNYENDLTTTEFDFEF